MVLPAWLVQVLALATVFLLLGSVASLALPRLAGELVDSCLRAQKGDVHQAKADINKYSLQVLAVLAAGGLAGGLRAWLFGSAAQRVMTKLRTKLFRRIMDQEVAFFDVTRTGDSKPRSHAEPRPCCTCWAPPYPAAPLQAKPNNCNCKAQQTPMTPQATVRDDSASACTPSNSACAHVPWRGAAAAVNRRADEPAVGGHAPDEGCSHCEPVHRAACRHRLHPGPPPHGVDLLAPHSPDHGE